MEGERLAHYEVLERLGGGGMGVVYKALDTRLDRHVALKLLPPELTRDDEARTRFVLEAKAASALDHPNICTIHDIDEAPNGQLFISMAYYEGETLKKRIERGPLPFEEALDLSIQVAQGLERAHESGIVHRDIKPANVMVTPDGLVKILDFGIAKLLDVTGPTQTGSSPGTVAYMSPEQIAGESADPQSDLWALGVVLYEMLTGRLPFKGENQWAVLNAISNRNPEPLTTLRAGLPTQIERFVLGALEKPRERRVPSAKAFVEAAKACQQALAPSATAKIPEANLLRTLLRPQLSVPVAISMAILGSLVVFSVNRNADMRWAREEALPEIALLVERNDLSGAFELAAEARRYIPNDPVLAELTPAFTSVYSVQTTPSGADVHVRPYDAVGETWELLGPSPVIDMNLPRGAYRWRVEHDGYDSVDLATASQTVDLELSLVETGSGQSGMVFVPGGTAPVSLTSFTLEPLTLEGFYIDEHEVTNQQFKEFLDAGGYADPEHWAGQRFVSDGQDLSWEEAMAEFVDTTGRPGPSTWELGDFPDGQPDYPVSGVSWHEAAAYARFRERRLPTLYHWSRAALSPEEVINPLGPEIVPLSNFQGSGAVSVGQREGVGPYGTRDMAGNVREWVWNAAGDERLILGGAWTDPEYLFSIAIAVRPLDRSPVNGFRTVRYGDDAEPPLELTAPVQLARPLAQPASLEVFEAYRTLFSYAPLPLNARAESTDLTSDDWIRERITLDAAYGDEEVVAYLFLPRESRPPYQTIVYFPGLGAFQSRRSSEDIVIGQGVTSLQVLEANVRTGRAVVWPIYSGSFERFAGRFDALRGQERDIFLRTQVVQWYQDLARTLDYLETRGDIDVERMAYLGGSYGASVALPLLALEERLKVAVLISGGAPYLMPPEVDAVTYLPRVTIPALMLNGSYDYIFPVQSSQLPMFELLGTPEPQKRHVLFEAGHSPLPRGPAIRETVEWLDQYLGPTD